MINSFSSTPSLNSGPLVVNLTMFIFETLQETFLYTLRPLSYFHMEFLASMCCLEAGSSLWFFHMVVLLTFEAHTCQCHFWNVSMLVFAFQPLLWVSVSERENDKSLAAESCSESS